MNSITTGCVFIVVYFLNQACAAQSKVYKQDGDLIIGGIIPIHFFDDSALECGKLRDISALRRVEAMRYAILNINNRSRLGGITLGYEIYDSCSAPVETLRVALNLIPPMRENESPVIGVVGPQRSANSIQATDLLGLYNITAVSYLSTSDELSDSDRFPYFLRTVPPDKYQVSVIIDIINKYQWKYVAFVYSDDSYGENAEAEFRIQAEVHGICIGYSRSISSTDEADVYEDVISDLLKRKEESLLSVVVLFTLVETVTSLFYHASEANVNRDFIWLGSDSWGQYSLSPLRGAEEAALGSLTIVPSAGIHPEFDDFFDRELASSSNPWKGEYFQECNCDSFTGYPLPSYESLVIDTVEVIARGIADMREEMCRELNKSQCIDVLIKNRRALRDYLLDVTFISDTNGLISFTKDGDSEGRYDVRYFMEKNGSYQFQNIGSWLESRESNLILGPIPWYLKKEANREIYTDENIPKSVCNDPCEPRLVMKQTRQECCWTCMACADYEFIDENECVSCFFEGNQTYMWPHPDLTHCVPLENLKLIDEVENLVLLTAAALGITAELVVAYLYIKNREEKLIRASSRELGYIILVGIFLAYSSAALYCVPAHNISCHLRRILPSIATSFIYVSLLTMTVRLYRIFTAGKKTAKRPQFISPMSQVFLTLVISLIPLVWGMVWIFMEPPEVGIIVPTKEHKYIEKICVVSEIHRIGQLVWEVFIVLINCYFAIRTRNLPANYNQTRFIAFSVFSSLIVFIAFAPAFFTTDVSSQQDLYSALGYIIQPTVVLILIFIARLYAVYFVKEEDQQVIMTRQRPSVACPPSPVRTVSSSAVNGSAPTTPGLTKFSRSSSDIFAQTNEVELDFSAGISPHVKSNETTENGCLTSDKVSSSSIEIHSIEEGEERKESDTKLGDQV